MHTHERGHILPPRARTHLVREHDPLESVVGFILGHVSAAFVGVQLKREFSVRLFDLLARGVVAHSKDLIV